MKDLFQQKIIIAFLLLFVPFNSYSEDAPSDETDHEFLEMLDNAPEVDNKDFTLETIVLPNGRTVADFLCEIEPEKFMKEHPEIDCKKYQKPKTVNKVYSYGCKSITCKKYNYRKEKIN